MERRYTPQFLEVKETIQVKEKEKIDVEINDTKEGQLKSFLQKIDANFDFPDYSKFDYWNKRYLNEKGKPFEWLLSYEILRPHMIPKMGKNYDAEILIVGCGNSTLGAGLYQDKFKNLTNIDFSYAVIQQMVEKYKEFEEMDFDVMDVTNVEYDDDCFDYIVDKATFDALLCDENEGLNRATLMLDHVFRILKPEGFYFMVSFAHPEKRFPFLKNKKYEWTVQVCEIEKETVPIIEGIENGKYNYLYICKKVA